MRSLFPLLLSLIACGQQDGDSNGPDTVRDSGDSGIDTDSGTPTDTFDPTEALALYDKDEDTYLDESVKEYQYYNQLVSSSNTPEDVRRHIASGLWDCNDTPPSPDGSDNGGADIHPETDDNTQDGVDNNCDGNIDEDYVAPADPVVDIVFDGEPAIVEVENVSDILNGLNIALGDLDGDSIQDLVAVATDWGTAEGKAYGFLSSRSYLPEGDTTSVTSADIQIEGGDSWNGLYSVATADGDGDGVDELYLGLDVLDAVLAIYDADTNPIWDLSDLVNSGEIPAGRDVAIVQGPETSGDGIVGNIINIGDVDGDGSVSLLASGGDFCGILNLSDFILGYFVDYTEVTTHELYVDTDAYYDASEVCKTGNTAIGDIDGDGKNELILGGLAGIYNGEAGNGWISRVDPTQYYMDFTFPGEFISSFGNYLFWTGVVGGDSVSKPVVGDFDGDGLADVCLNGDGIDNGHTDSGAANCIFGSDISSKWANPALEPEDDTASGVLHNGDSITVGYTGPIENSDFDLSIFDSPKSFYGDTTNADLTSNSSAIWSDKEKYPGISLLAMGANQYAGGDTGAIFVSRHSRATSTTGHEIIVSTSNSDTKLVGQAGDYVGQTVKFGDLNGDGVPDLVATATGTGKIYVWYGREKHQSEV